MLGVLQSEDLGTGGCGMLIKRYPQCFKGVGRRWREDGFNHLLHLRLAWVNGTR